MDLPDLQSALPFLQQLTFGGVAGFAAGYALKKVGKLVAIAVGLLFVVLQLLAFNNLVTVNWAEVQGRVEPYFTADSLEEAWRGLVRVLTYNVTFAAAFVPGLVFGLRRG